MTKSVMGLMAITALCFSMLTAGAMALSASLFSLVSTVIEAVHHDGRTVRRSHAAEVARLEAKAVEIDRRATGIEQELADSEQNLAESERKRVDSDLKLRTTTDELNKLKADKFVSFKGEKRAIKEVVAETASTVSKIAGKTAILNVGSMPAEGIPLVGLAAIVAATTLEVKSLCDISKAMYQLDVSMNPENAIVDHQEACGVAVPTKDDLIKKVVESPRVVWEKATEAIDGLPTLEEAYQALPTTDEVIGSAIASGIAISGFGEDLWDWLTE